MKRLWTEVELAVLRSRYPNECAADIARDLGRTVGQVHNAANVRGLKKSPKFWQDAQKSWRIAQGTHVNSRKHQFQRGQESWNKGTHYVAGGRSAETRFKKGNMSGAAQRKYVAVGTERINRDGYLERKVTDAGETNAERQRRWVGVHSIVWETVNGPIPAGSIVVFKPGVRTTVAAEITLDKLELITRVENMRRNTCHRYPKEIALAIQLRGALSRKINKRLRQHEEQNG